jgi:uncharacterized protein YlzI (FlbEa/FlbD family)
VIVVTQKLPSGNTQTVYMNPDNIERVLPYNGGTTIQCVSGSSTEVVETPAEIYSRIGAN